ncbi:hypothetical protein HYW41_00735 [Candidatus Daviesbacteria bacterium]|nr:hypothetical protein [Candidatus Daviesbacteria bacterium]
MSQPQIRLARTSDVNKVLSFLRSKYQLLSEADIIKLALSEKYIQEQENIADKEERIRQAWGYLKKEGKKIGNRLMREKGLDPKKITEQQFYDLILNDHKHD